MSAPKVRERVLQGLRDQRMRGHDVRRPVARGMDGRRVLGRVQLLLRFDRALQGVASASAMRDGLDPGQTVTGLVRGLAGNPFGGSLASPTGSAAPPGAGSAPAAAPRPPRPRGGPPARA